MAAKNNRFEIIYTQGSSFTQLVQLLVDKETGIQYLFTQSGSAGGLTPLLDADGNPIKTK